MYVCVSSNLVNVVMYGHAIETVRDSKLMGARIHWLTVASFDVPP